MKAWRPIRMALLYALLGPLIGAGLLAAALGGSAAAWAPRGLDLISVYIIGFPPLLATGFIVAVMAQRGRSFFGLWLMSTLIGAGFGALSAAFYGFLVPEASPNLRFFMAMIIAGGAAGFCCLVLVGLMTLFRSPGGG
jgi:hypothetical protein